MEEQTKQPSPITAIARIIRNLIDFVSIVATIAMLVLAIYHYANDRLATITLIFLLILALFYVITLVFRANARYIDHQKQKKRTAE